jgi:alpha-beta hydrolase superfamily lysophospholipase
MAKYLKILAAILVVYVLVSGGLAWYATSTYRPGAQADQGTIGFKVEEVQFKTSDAVTLRGWWVDGYDGAPVIAIFHGHRATRMDSMPLARALLLSGYNMLLLDMRGCGKSDGNCQTYGVKEAFDVAASVKYLTEVRGFTRNRIGIAAFGTGASATILARDFVQDIGAIALLAPYTTLPTTLDHGCRNLAGFGVSGVGLVFMEFMKMRIGQSPSLVRPIDRIAQLAPTPLLIVGAEEDKAAPPMDIRELFQKAKEPKELYTVPKATRERLTDLNGSDLKMKLIEFFDGYLR